MDQTQKLENLFSVNFNFDQWLFDSISSAGFTQGSIPYIAFSIEFVIVVSIILFIDFITRKIILKLLNIFVERSKVTWDDEFMKFNVFKNAAHLVPIAAANWIVSGVMAHFPDFIAAVKVLSSMAFIWVFVLTIYSIIGATLQLTKDKDNYIAITLQSLSQLIKIGIFIFALIATFSILLNLPLGQIVGTLGALTAVILLVFKDTILGFVASVQMSLSKMVKLGDWIVLPSYSADGPLIELNLMTAKIQNWDKTVTTVPTYALISSAVKNWDGMAQAGVRRIKRSINFDVNSVEFLSPEKLEDLKRINILKDFIISKQEEIESFNAEKGYDTSVRINGRRQTNIGLFRKYAELYLNNHKDISKKETLMVRQLQSGEFGLPLEVYCFSTNINWVDYEGIQSDIFDHLISASKEFGLEIHQNPTGKDFQKFR